MSNEKLHYDSQKNCNYDTMPKLVDDAGHYWNSTKLQSSPMWTEYRWVALSNSQGYYDNVTISSTCTIKHTLK